MFTLENQQIIIFIEENHLVQCCLLPPLFENNSKFLMAETAVSLLQTFETMLSILRIPHEVKLVQRQVRFRHFVESQVPVLPD